MLRSDFNYSYGNVFYNFNIYYYNKYSKTIKTKKILNLVNYCSFNKNLSNTVFWQEKFLNFYSYLFLTNTTLNVTLGSTKKQQILVFFDIFI